MTNETPEQTCTRVIAESAVAYANRRNPIDWKRHAIHDLAVVLQGVIERLDERDTEPLGEMTRPGRPRKGEVVR